MQIHHVEDFGADLEIVREHREEAGNLADDLLITVTQFFRDPSTYEFLEQDVLPRLFQGKGSEDHIRIWSIGCATGEEAYSLAMVLLEAATRRNDSPRIQIFASDLHDLSLRKAREGVYPESIRESVGPERLRRFFAKEDSTYRVRKNLREAIVFAPHNLLRDPPFAHIDLVSCRNLLIYLEREAQGEVLTLLHYALNPDGLLLLGSSESVDRSNLFLPENKEHRLYRRRNVPARELHLPMTARSVFGPPGKPELGPARSRPRPREHGALHERLVERYAPPSVLVTDDLRILHSSSGAGRYLHLPGGEPTNSLLKVVRNPLRAEVRAVLHAARENPGTVKGNPVRMEIGGEARKVTVRARRVEEPDQDDLFLVMFEEASNFPESTPEADRPKSDATIRELELELEHTRERLRTAIEDYETSQEEMQTSFEELQSTNEELRSTLEELETSKEELQSVNEELSTVNQENRHRLVELAQVSADLQNLLTAIDIATLFLDRNLHIVRFTPRVADLFSIRVADRGRPLGDLTHRLGPRISRTTPGRCSTGWSRWNARSRARTGDGI